MGGHFPEQETGFLQTSKQAEIDTAGNAGGKALKTKLFLSLQIICRLEDAGCVLGPFG